MKNSKHCSTKSAPIRLSLKKTEAYGYTNLLDKRKRKTKF